MKKFYSLILAVSCLSFASSQDIEIYKTGSTVDISGTIIYASWEDPSVKELLTIKNISTGAKDLKIKRLKIDEVAGTTDYLCWGLSLNAGEGLCYPASSVSPVNPWTSNDSYTFQSGNEGILYVYYTPDGNYGAAKYRYFVMEDGTALASVDVVFNYFLSINNQKPTSISVYPNPAEDVLNIQVENLSQNGTIEVFDISGKQVLKTNIQNGKNQLNVSILNSGVYFYTVRNNRDIIETKKLLIK